MTIMKFLKKNNQRDMPLFFVMTTFLLSLFIISSSIVFVYNQKFARTESLKKASIDIQTMTTMMTSKIGDFLGNFTDDLKVLAMNTAQIIEDADLKTDDNKEFSEIKLYQQIERALYSIFVAKEQITNISCTLEKGDCINLVDTKYIKNKNFDKKIKKKDIPETVRHVSNIMVFDKKLAMSLYRDTNDNLLKEDVEKNSPEISDARMRPWYRLVKEKKGIVWSDPYDIEDYNESVVTVAMPLIIPKKGFYGVISIDISLCVLSDLLKSFRWSEKDPRNVFLIKKNGLLIAHSNHHMNSHQSLVNKSIFDIQPETFSMAFKNFKYDHHKSGKFLNDRSYYLYAFDECSYDEGRSIEWLLGTVAPETWWNSFIFKTQKINLILSVLTGFVIFLGVLFFARRISVPIKLVQQDLQDIEHLDIPPSLDVSSCIREVNSIVTSVNTMKVGIKAFSQYVPKTLVKKLLDEGVSISPGGIKKEVSILFSDIKGFTSISEQTSPQLLIGQLCDYFGSLVNIIQDKNGTIDKFIGDSIMAFWGAPVENPNHAINACEAVLLCKKRNEELNNAWNLKQHPAFFTRFGLNVGDVIVGNIGTSERLSYTAIGDPVNFASRLEGTNKFYKTSILVSDSVVDNAKYQYFFRLIDNIQVVGKEHGVMIYEMIGTMHETEHLERVSLDMQEVIRLSEEAFHLYKERDFKHALKIYKNILKIIPKDHIAEIFIERCKFYIDNPPQDYWTPVFKLPSK